MGVSWIVPHDTRDSRRCGCDDGGINAGYVFVEKKLQNHCLVSSGESCLNRAANLSTGQREITMNYIPKL